MSLNIEAYLQELKEELVLRNYSSQTMKSYTASVRHYLQTYSMDCTPTPKHMRTFLYAQYEAGKSSQTINVCLNALNFFFRNIIYSRTIPHLHFAKRTRKLPVILSRDEINHILNALINPKHRLIIALAYSAGLRVSELIKLNIEDVSLTDLILRIHEGKGHKERLTIISEKLVADLQIIMWKRPIDDPLFKSERGGRLTTRTMQKIFKIALIKAGIQKSATFHSLRHSFATQLIEDGVDIRYVQALLGHQNIRTTQLYTQVTTVGLKKIKSPL